MTASSVPLTQEDIPIINPLYLFRWEEQEQAYLLLYPEGIIKLNESAGNILKLCDGTRNLSQIIVELKQLFNTDDIDDDVHKFMEAAHGKGWIKAQD